jgi:NADH:ubiquinone oxidoreductase subunit 5 (subunit L)/multisubunit Na+/H+ antiporter MnhA subunit
MCSLVHAAHELTFFVLLIICLAAFFALLSRGKFLIGPLLGAVFLGESKERRTALLWLGIAVVITTICILVLVYSPSYLNNSCHIPTPRF